MTGGEMIVLALAHLYVVAALGILVMILLRWWDEISELLAALLLILAAVFAVGLLGVAGGEVAHFWIR